MCRFSPAERHEGAVSIRPLVRSTTVTKRFFFGPPSPNGPRAMTFGSSIRYQEKARDRPLRTAPLIDCEGNGLAWHDLALAATSRPTARRQARCTPTTPQPNEACEPGAAHEHESSGDSPPSNMLGDALKLSASTHLAKIATRRPDTMRPNAIARGSRGRRIVRPYGASVKVSSSIVGTNSNPSVRGETFSDAVPAALQRLLACLTPGDASRSSSFSSLIFHPSSFSDWPRAFNSDEMRLRMVPPGFAFLPA